MGKSYSPTKKKILLLLATGIDLSFNISPLGHIRAWKKFGKEWSKINEENLKRSIREFYRNRLVDFKKNNDGTMSVIISEKGNNKATIYKINEMMPKKEKSWDGKWRIVIFDIPEEKRLARDVLRIKIKSLGFVELQKSVWVYPYDYKSILDFITNFYRLDEYVNYIVAENIADDKKIRDHFDLK